MPGIEIYTARNAKTEIVSQSDINLGNKKPYYASSGK